MKTETENLMRNLLAMDAGIDSAAVEHAIRYLRGEEPGDTLIRVIRFKDVQSLLHIHRRTLDYYIQQGYLDRVYGGGKRAIGISRESYLRFTSLRVASQESRRAPSRERAVA